MDRTDGVPAGLQGAVMSARRRLVRWALCVVLVVSGIGFAHAEVYENQPAALAGCQAEASAAVAAARANRYVTGKTRCVLQDGATESNGRYRCEFEVSDRKDLSSPYFIGCVNASREDWHGWTKPCPADQPWDERTKTCTKACSANDPQIWSGAASDGLPVYTRCRVEDGRACEYFFSRDPAGPGHIGTPVGASCDVQEYECAEGWEHGVGPVSSFASQICVPKNECPEGQTMVRGECKIKEDECPRGKVPDAEGKCVVERNECPSGQVKGPDGSCVDDPKAQCPAGKVKGADGTCKSDADGDGNADEDDPNNKSFSGGDDCNVPPACSGDPIACGQARIQWRIECNTRKNRNISGGSCDAMPVCAGEKCDAMEYAQLLQTWRTACAVEKLKMSGPAGDGNKNGVPDVMEQGVDEGANESAQVREDDGSGLMGMVDQGGFAAGGGCPGLPPLQVGGMSLDLGSVACQQAEAVRAVLLMFAMYVAAMIIGARAAGGG